MQRFPGRDGDSRIDVIADNFCRDDDGVRAAKGVIECPDPVVAAQEITNIGNSALSRCARAGDGKNRQGSGQRCASRQKVASG